MQATVTQNLRGAARLALLFALFVMPARLAGQTWTAALTGQDARPANDSPASSAITLTLTGTTLLVQLSWQDLAQSPQGVLLFAAPPRHGADRTALLVGLREFTPARSGIHSERIDLGARSSYDADFLRLHGGRVELARDALIAALDTAYVAIITPPGAVIELGAPVRRVSPTGEQRERMH